MADDQYPHAIGVGNAKKYGIGKPVNDAAPDLRLDDRELRRIADDSRHYGIDLASGIGIQVSGIGSAA